MEKSKRILHVWDDNAVCINCGRDGVDEYFEWIRWLGADDCPRTYCCPKGGFHQDGTDGMHSNIFCKKCFRTG